MMRRTLSALTLVAALVGPVLLPVTAQAQDRDRRERDRRMYDRAHRDYHRWSADEDRAYRAYLAERHRAYREFRHLNSRQQREYWLWRHR